MITTGNFVELLEPGLKKIYGDKYNAWRKEYTEIFDILTSEKSSEEYQGITGLGNVSEKQQGKSVNYSDPQQGFKTTLTNITYGLGFIVTKEMAEDDLYNKINAMPSALAQSVMNTVETLGGLVLDRAFDSNFAFGDGKELCATDHPLENGGTLSNELATPADLSETSFEQMTIDVAAFTDGQGLKINAMPQKLIVAQNDNYTAAKILQSNQEPETGNNAINPARGILPGGYLVSHFVTDPDAWFVRTNVPGLICQKRRWPADMTRDNDFDTENGKFKTTFRLQYGAYDPRSIFGTPGAA